jgi:DNA invertase Pin-like site-specific DNA recombinase
VDVNSLEFVSKIAGNQNGYKIVQEFYDPAIKGKDLLQNRPGFSELLAFCKENNISEVLFENHFIF